MAIRYYGQPCFKKQTEAALSQIKSDPRFLRECWQVMNSIKDGSDDKKEIASQGQISDFLNDMEAATRRLLNLVEQKPADALNLELIQEERRQLPIRLKAISERQGLKPVSLELSRYHIKHRLAVLWLEQVFKEHNLPIKGKRAKLQDCLALLFNEARYKLDSESLRRLVWKAHQPIPLKSRPGKTARLFCSPSRKL
jgi:hypothetical protein